VQCVRCHVSLLQQPHLQQAERIIAAI